MHRNYETRFGTFTFEVYDGFVTSAYFVHLSEIANKTESTQSRKSEFVRNTSALPLQPQGSPFQSRVWARITKLVSCEVPTYHKIATSNSVSSAVLAVASALSKNPTAYLISCHRIILADGKIGGYRWTRSLKRMLLNHEKFILL